MIFDQALCIARINDRCLRLPASGDGRLLALKDVTVHLCLLAANAAERRDFPAFDELMRAVRHLSGLMATGVAGMELVTKALALDLVTAALLRLTHPEEDLPSPAAVTVRFDREQMQRQCGAVLNRWGESDQAERPHAVRNLALLYAYGAIDAAWRAEAMLLAANAQAVQLCQVVAALLEQSHAAPSTTVDALADAVATRVAALVPPSVNITNHVPPAEVTVKLPARKTDTTVQRDRDGNLTHATQIETDA